MGTIRGAERNRRREPSKHPIQSLCLESASRYTKEKDLANARDQILFQTSVDLCTPQENTESYHNMPDVDAMAMPDPLCIFKRYPAICVQDSSTRDDNTVCQMCQETIPQILNTQLEEHRHHISDQLYRQLYQLIEPGWQSTAPIAHEQYTCVARQTRFRGTGLIEQVAAAREADNKDTIDERPENHKVDVKYAPCDSVPDVLELCWECSYAVRNHGSDDLKTKFHDLETQQNLVVKDSTTRRPN
jgi:hypothetical protein